MGQRALDGLVGDDPPFHHPAFVLTHHPRASITMQGGTTFHFVTVPMLLGSGERLFDHLDGGPVGYECVEFVGSPAVVHARFARSAPKSEER